VLLSNFYIFYALYYLVRDYEVKENRAQAISLLHIHGYQYNFSQDVSSFYFCDVILLHFSNDFFRRCYAWRTKYVLQMHSVKSLFKIEQWLVELYCFFDKLYIEDIRYIYIYNRPIVLEALLFFLYIYIIIYIRILDLFIVFSTRIFVNIFRMEQNYLSSFSSS